ncbi:hypothetical protein NL676_008442 [Syzygium grande]|nr:hypothetical protein NL676_008442 [Syzygium grande]
MASKASPRYCLVSPAASFLFQLLPMFLFFSVASHVPDVVRRERSMTFTVGGFSIFTHSAKICQQRAGPRRAESVSRDGLGLFKSSGEGYYSSIG